MARKPTYEELEQRVKEYKKEAVDRKQTEEALREAEERYRTLVEGAAEGIIVADIETRKFKYVNPASCRMLGYSEEELKRMSVVDIHPKEALGHVISEFKDQAKGEKALAENIPCLRKDGTTIYADINTTKAMIDGRGCNVGFFTEITERKRVEEALKESEQRFRELADLLPVSVFELNVDGNFTYSNRCGFETFGYSHKDLANGVNALELFIPEERQRVWQNIKKRLAGKEFEDHEYTGLGKDGSIFPMLVYSDPIVANNKVVGVRGIVLDITERKRAEEALQKARDELERRVEERTAELLKANEQLKIETEERERTEEKYKTLVESSLTGIFIHQDGKYVFMNDRFGDIHGYQPEELLGRDPLTLIHPDEGEALGQVLSKRLKGEDAPNRYEVRRLKKDGETIWCEMMATRIEYAGRPAIMGNIIDITERKQAEEALLESTRRLQLAYDQAISYAKQLNKEIDERKRAEEALQRKKEQLKAKAQSLEEVNTALRVLLKQREEDKTELEEKVLSNVKQLVMPHIETLRKSRLGDKQMACVNIIESNLTDIVSPFLQKLSSKYLGLTPKEIQIADLVKLGNTNKDIADLLNVSTGTIEFHRENIRTKLGLKNKKVNLKSFLFSLE